MQPQQTLIGRTTIPDTLTMRDFFLFCRDLKEDGFPQPHLKVGQIWFNELGIAGQLYEAMDGGFGVKVLENGHLNKMGSTPSEGMVYCPTNIEIINFLNNKENAATGEGAAGIQ